MFQRSLNVKSSSADWRARALSNFSPHDCILDGERFASVEGFIQGTKYAEGDVRRQKAFTLCGKDAKKMGKGAVRSWVWWNGEQIPYGSSEHHELIARAIRAKFAFNEGPRLALAASESLELVHNVDSEPRHTSLPATVFCRILTELRQELQETGTVEPP